MAKKKSKKENWIQEAIKNKGALRRQAMAEGAITRSGTISVGWLREKAKEGGVTGRRARLALTLRKLNQKRK